MTARFQAKEDAGGGFRVPFVFYSIGRIALRKLERTQVQRLENVPAHQAPPRAGRGLRVSRNHATVNTGKQSIAMPSAGRVLLQTSTILELLVAFAAAPR